MLQLTVVKITAVKWVSKRPKNVSNPPASLWDWHLVPMERLQNAKRHIGHTEVLPCKISCRLVGPLMRDPWSDKQTNKQPVGLCQAAQSGCVIFRDLAALSDVMLGIAWHQLLRWYFLDIKYGIVSLLACRICAAAKCCERNVWKWPG